MSNQLKPCPFCNARLEVRGKNFVHPHGKCILSGHHFKSGFIGQWNKRVPDAALSAEVERLTLVKSEMHAAAMEAVARAEAAEAEVERLTAEASAEVKEAVNAAAPVVKVKPLVWNLCFTHGGKAWIARGVHDSYRVPEARSYLDIQRVEREKIAAQADHERCVFSMLDIQPDPTLCARSGSRADPAARSPSISA